MIDPYPHPEVIEEARKLRPSERILHYRGVEHEHCWTQYILNDGSQATLCWLCGKDKYVDRYLLPEPSPLA